MEALLDSLLQLITAAWDLVIVIVSLAVPFLPLIAWIAFWLLAVNWVKLFPILARGGWTGLVFTALMMILIWGNIAPPESGHHHLFGLTVDNFFGKTIYVTGLFCIMLLCGVVQLSGSCDRWLNFPDDEEEEAEDHAHAGH